MRTSSSWAGPLLVALSAALCGVTGCGSDDDDGNFELEGSGGQMQTGGGGAGAGSQSGGGGSGGSGAGSQSGGGGSGGSVVDPGATVLSYLGESSSVELVGDMGRDVAVDADGNFYVTGGLDRMNGAPFNGALGKSFGSRDDEDIFVVSFDPEGALRYATIIGGPNYDRAYAIEVDANGRAIVAGRAGNGFPTTAGVVQPTFADDNTPNGAYGKQDGVLFMLDETGDLTWATYLGSGGRDFIRDIDLGPDGSIFAAVAAAVGPYPYATSGSFVDTPPSGSNTVLVKINPAATAVSWGGYLGGSGDETSPPAIRVNAAGEAFVVWSSSANNVPITPGAYQTTLGGGSDLVVARVAADGGSLIYCTYVGGAGDELVETHQIAINSSNQVVVVTAVDTPLPGVNGLQQTIAGGRDMLLAKLSADGSSLVAATYLGGSADEHAEGIMIGSSGEVYVTGSTPSVDFPTTANALQGTKGAAGDGVVAILSADLSELVYSTFVGGDAGDQLRGVAIGPQLEILATGQTASSNLAVTPEAVQSTYGGGPTDVMYVRIPRPE